MIISLVYEDDLNYKYGEVVMVQYFELIFKSFDGISRATYSIRRHSFPLALVLSLFTWRDNM
jgi:hypothetical protein